jgi:hypothetical protein
MDDNMKQRVARLWRQNASLNTKKLRLRQDEHRGTLYNEKCFDVHEKKGRCFFAFGSKAVTVGFVHNKAIYAWMEK